MSLKWFLFLFHRRDGGCTADRCFNFRHFGPFTDNGTELQRRFDAVRLAGNIDAPEAGLDAIGQLALCGDKIGWRDDAVKIVLYFSDDSFHFAGEGRVKSLYLSSPSLTLSP